MAEEVRWLDDDEREAWLALVGMVVRLPAALDAQLRRDCTRLERQGWIERSADPVDKRAKRATLTDAGHAKVVATAPGHVEAVRALVFDRLTTQQVKQLGEAANRILGAIGSEPC